MRTVATFSKPEEAHLFRTWLEGAGIPAFVHDESIVQLDWFMSNAIGGVRVQVAEEDFDSAREFIAAEAAREVPQASEFPCPHCGSERTAVDEFPRRMGFLTVLFFMCALWPLALASLTALVFNLRLRYSDRRWRCHDCNHLWRPNSELTGFVA
jgi:hypothetical protein